MFLETVIKGTRYTPYFLLYYLNYYLLIFKVIIIIISKSKLVNIKAIFNIRAKVSIISLDIIVRFKIPIIYNTGIAL